MEPLPVTTPRESGADAVLLELAARVQACSINNGPTTEYPRMDVPLIDCTALAPESEKPSPLYTASVQCVWTQGRFAGDKVLAVGLASDNSLRMAQFSLTSSEWTQELRAGTLTAEPDAGACSRDSNLLLLCVGTGLHFYRVSDTEATEHMMADPNVGDRVRSCSVHPTGKLSAVVTGSGAQVVVYSMGDYPRTAGVVTMSDGQQATCVEFTADGHSMLIVAGDNIISQFEVSCENFALECKGALRMRPSQKDVLREFVTNKTSFQFDLSEPAVLCTVNSNGVHALATRHHLSVCWPGKSRIFCPETAGVVALSLQPLYYAVIDVTGMLELWDYDGNLRQRAAPQRTNHQFATERSLACKCVVCKQAKRQTPNALCKPVVYVRDDQRFLCVVDQWTVAREMSASVL